MDKICIVNSDIVIILAAFCIITPTVSCIHLLPAVCSCSPYRSSLPLRLLFLLSSRRLPRRYRTAAHRRSARCARVPCVYPLAEEDILRDPDSVSTLPVTVAGHSGVTVSSGTVYLSHGGDFPRVAFTRKSLFDEETVEDT